MANKFWTPDRLMSLKDISGEKPEIFLVGGNRTAGKTFGTKTYLINGVKTGKIREFFCLVRFGYEIDGYAENFFQDIGPVKFPNDKMTMKTGVKDAYSIMLLNGKVIGYVIAINQADLVKRHFAKFTKCDLGFFDEFQSETGKYCPKEIDKFFSIHTSIARGDGNYTRHVPVIMCANNVSVLNPYYVGLGIHKRLQPETKTLKGDGWVLELVNNEGAKEAIKLSGFGRAFAGTRQAQYAAGDKYLIDTSAFVENIEGQKSPLLNMIINGEKCTVWTVKDNGLIYVSEKGDPACDYTITGKVTDHGSGTVLAKYGEQQVKVFKKMFELGEVRFQNVKCKNIFLDMIGLSLI